MDDTPYSRAEIAALSQDAAPERGVHCQSCGAIIPRFEDISPEDEERLRQGSFMDRMRFAREQTGCPMLWAKIWALHPHGGHDTTPCPECGKPLRTKLAQQCWECGADWHG